MKTKKIEKMNLDFSYEHHLRCEFRRGFYDGATKAIKQGGHDNKKYDEGYELGSRYKRIISPQEDEQMNDMLSGEMK
jgi:hypothetical protein